jgi:integrase
MSESERKPVSEEHARQLAKALDALMQKPLIDWAKPPSDEIITVAGLIEYGAGIFSMINEGLPDDSSKARFSSAERVRNSGSHVGEDVIGPDGKSERIRRSEVLGTVADIPTRRDAKQLLSDRLPAVNSGENRTQSTWTLKGFIQDRWLPEVLPTIKYSTQLHYKYIVKVHLIPTLGDMQLRLITRESIQSLLTSKRRSGLSWRTVKHIHTTFGTILAAAVMEGLIPDNAVRKTKLPRRGPIAEKAPIDPGKLRALLEALPEPSRSLAWLLSFTGLRIGELLALRWSDVDLEGGFIRVRQTVYEGQFDDPKSKRSRRTVPLGTQGAEILKGRKPEACDPEALVFAARNGSPLCRRNLLNRQLKPTCEKLKLEGVTWHWLRHANATLLDSVGASLGTMQALPTVECFAETVPTYRHMPHGSRCAGSRSTVARRTHPTFLSSAPAQTTRAPRSPGC